MYIDKELVHQHTRVLFVTFYAFKIVETEHSYALDLHACTCMDCAFGTVGYLNLCVANLLCVADSQQSNWSVSDVSVC